MASEFKPMTRRSASKRAEVEAAKLPPPGATRDEVLAKRKDALQEAAEVQAKAAGVEALNPAALDVERELAQHFDELDVQFARPDYHYTWVNFDYPSSSRGLMVRQKLALRGWEVVNKLDDDMPEAPELRDVSGNRRLGDVILMRIRKDRWAILQRQEVENRLRHEQGITSTLQELGHKYRDKGVIVHTPDSMPPEMLKRMESTARGAQAARQRLDQNLRQGTIEGMPPTR